MNPDSAAAMLSSWEFDPVIVGVLLLVSGIYLRGWLTLRSRGARHYTARHLTCYGFGLAALYVALQSPLDIFAAFSLQVHMVQHLFLIIVVPPLILWSAPGLPWLVGLPPWLLDWFGPFSRWRLLQALVRRMVHPVTSWLVLVGLLWLWHWPAMYQLALENPAWHRWEHASLLVASMLFWWPVMQPYHSRTAVSKWWLIPYLFLAGVQGTVLAGLITFSDRVLYANYAVVPNPWGLTALEDQQLAGALMWVPMSLALLIALVWVIGQQMSGAGVRAVRRTSKSVRKLEKIDGLGSPSYGSELLITAGARLTGATRLGRGRRIRETVFGKLFRRRPVRRTIQLIMLALTLIVVVDGFWGPQVSAVNLAGVAPWIHCRGLLVITLLIGGNFFCLACPFTAFRSLVRRWFSPTGHWPRRLQTKWLSVGVLILFFWAYETFSLWDRPAWTAAIVVGFFCAALAFDALFVNAPFCKFVCPIGQFNFVYSLVSPTEVATVSPAVCTNCTTKDCLAGNERAPGCQLSLFLPKKSGNMDCTCCLDCADACPHDNIVLLSVAPGSDLTGNQRRSGVGRYAQRADLAALFVVLLFASLVNAAWMTAPVVQWETQVTRTLGIDRWAVVTLGMLLGLCIAPLVVTAAVACCSDWAASRRAGWVSTARRFAPALVPLGLGMWLSHYSFHLFTSGDAIGVAASRFLSDWTGRGFTVAAAACSCCDASVIPWLLPLELLLLDFGLCVSLYAVYRVARSDMPGRHWIGAAAPWFLFVVLFFASCVWVLLQPMQMRGVSMAGM